MPQNWLIIVLMQQCAQCIKLKIYFPFPKPFSSFVSLSTLPRLDSFFVISLSHLFINLTHLTTVVPHLNRVIVTGVDSFSRRVYASKKGLVMIHKLLGICCYLFLGRCFSQRAHLPVFFYIKYQIKTKFSTKFLKCKNKQCAGFSSENELGELALRHRGVLI